MPGGIVTAKSLNGNGENVLHKVVKLLSLLKFTLPIEMRRSANVHKLHKYSENIDFLVDKKSRPLIVHVWQRTAQKISLCRSRLQPGGLMAGLLGQSYRGIGSVRSNGDESTTIFQRDGRDGECFARRFGLA
jgi:hypothetical protein